MSAAKTLSVAGLMLLSIAASARGGGETSGEPTQLCVNVRIGDDQTAYLNCLNEELKRRAEREQNAPSPVVPLGAQSAPNQVGLATDAAGRERMGTSFGNSAVPQRPQSNFVNPLAPVASH